MTRTAKIAVTLAATALVAGGALAAVDAAAASPSTHTLHLTAVQLNSTQSKNAFTQAEKDVQGGKVTGYDAVNCIFNSKTHNAACDGSFARSNGMIYVHATVGRTGHGKGTITGGTRAYKAASGTITLAPGAARNQTKITISYTG